MGPPPPPANAQEPDRPPVPPNSLGAGNVGAVDGNSSSGSTGSGGDGGRLSGVDGNGVPTLPSMAAPALANLPAAATHSYLGEATGSSLSRRDLEVGSTIDMPILSLPGVVLFPGESLPLRLHNPAYALLAESLLGSGEGAGARGRERDGEGGDRQAARHLGVVNRLDSRSGGRVEACQSLPYGRDVHHTRDSQMLWLASVGGKKQNTLKVSFCGWESIVGSRCESENANS